MSGDWADDTAAEVLSLILQSEVRLDDACEIIAANLRLADAKGELRAIREVSAALKGQPS